MTTVRRRRCRVTQTAMGLAAAYRAQKRGPYLAALRLQALGAAHDAQKSPLPALRGESFWYRYTSYVQ